MIINKDVIVPGFTSIEQSGRLIEAGIDITSHDLHYKKCPDYPDKIHWGDYDLLVGNEKVDKSGYVIPCWSDGNLIRIVESIGVHISYSNKVWIATYNTWPDNRAFRLGEMSGESLPEVIIAALIDIKTKRNEKPDTDFI